LLRRPEGGGDTYDYFRDRVIFPIGDRRGRMIAFGGRVMGDGQPKYLNSPDTPLFQKGRVLYGWALARAAAAKEPSAIAVEGYMDVIALHRAGFATAVAPLGTALTEAQIEELWRLAPEPILCFDGDTAGQRAAGHALARAMPILKPGFSLRFATLPTGEDPDSLLLRHGAAALREVLDRARPLAEVLWSFETAQPIDTPERRAALEKRLEQQVRLIADRSVQEHYRNFYREKLVEIFRARRGPIGGRSFRPGLKTSRRFGDRPRPARFGDYLPSWRETAPARDPALNMRRRGEVVLALILNHPFLLSEFDEDLVALELHAPDLDSLSRAIQKAHQMQPDLEQVALKSHLKSNGFAELVERVLSPEVLDHADFARPEATREAVREGWVHMRTQFQRRLSATEIEAVVAEFASNPTPENWGRLEQLQRTELESKDQDEGAV
jgi:DNA primase